MCQSYPSLPYMRGATPSWRIPTKLGKCVHLTNVIKRAQCHRYNVRVFVAVRCWSFHVAGACSQDVLNTLLCATAQQVMRQLLSPLSSLSSCCYCSRCANTPWDWWWVKVSGFIITSRLIFQLSDEHCRSMRWTSPIRRVDWREPDKLQLQSI